MYIPDQSPIHPLIVGIVLRHERLHHLVHYTKADPRYDTKVAAIGVDVPQSADGEIDPSPSNARSAAVPNKKVTPIRRCDLSSVVGDHHLLPAVLGAVGGQHAVVNGDDVVGVDLSNGELVGTWCPAGAGGVAIVFGVTAGVLRAARAHIVVVGPPRCARVKH